MTGAPRMVASTRREDRAFALGCALLLAVVTTSLLTVSPAFAQTFTYSGTDGFLNTPGDWTPSGPPTNASSSVWWFNTSTNTSITDDLPGGSYSLGGMTFGIGASSFTFNGTNVLNLSNGLTNLSGTSVENFGAGLTFALATDIKIAAVAGGGFSIGGVISGAHGVNKTGVGTLTLTGQNTYTGTTSLSGGLTVLDFTGASTAIQNSGIIAGAIVTGSGSGTALNMAGGSLSILGAASGASNQTFTGVTYGAGSGTISVTGNTGGVTLTLGALTHATGGTLNFQSISGTVAINTSTANNANTKILGGGIFYNGNDFASISGVALTNPIGKFTGYLNGPGNNPSNWTGTLPNVYTNIAATTWSTASRSMGFNTTIAGLQLGITTAATALSLNGHILVVNDQTTNSVGGIIISSGAGGTVTINNSGVGTAFLTAGKELVFQNNLTAFGTTVSTPIGDNTFSGIVPVDVVISGVGTTTFSSSFGSNFYSGGTYINGGSLDVVGVANATTNSSFLGSGGIFFNGGTLGFFGLASTTYSESINVTVGPQGGTLAGTRAASITTSILGGGVLSITNSSTITFAGNNSTATFSLNVADNSTLEVAGTANSSALGTGTITISGNAITTAGDINLRTTKETLVNNIYISGFGQIDDITGAGTLSGVISGGTFLADAPSGNTMSISGTSNSYAGLVILGSGTLIIVGDGSLGAVPSAPSTANPDITFSSGNSILAFGANNITVNANRTIQINTGINANINALANAAGTIAGSIQGPGAITTTTSGTISFTGASLYSGGTTINAGTLAIGTGTSLGTGTVSFGGGAAPTLALNGLSLTVGTITSSSGVGVINNGTGGATLGTIVLNGANAGGTGNYGGAIGAAGNANVALNVNVSGTAIVTLSGAASPYTGGTTVTSGTLVISNNLNTSTPLGSGAVSVLAGAALDSSGGSVGGGGGGVTINAGATLSLGFGAAGAFSLGGNLVGSGTNFISPSTAANFNFVLGSSIDQSTITIAGNLSLTNAILNVSNAAVGTYNLVHFTTDTGNTSFSAITGISNSFLATQVVDSTNHVLELVISNTSQTLTWSGGAGTPPSDGPGTWQTGGASNFWTGTALTTWSDNNQAVFGSANPVGASTVVLGSNITASNLTFNSGNNYTIAPDGGNLYSLSISTGLTASDSASITRRSFWEAAKRGPWLPAKC